MSNKIVVLDGMSTRCVLRATGCVLRYVPCTATANIVSNIGINICNTLKQRGAVSLENAVPYFIDQAWQCVK